MQLLDDPQASILDEVAKKVGVEKIGWIVTDLVAENLQLGTVCHLRHKDTYYVSAEECIMAADFQNKHPNVCKLSPNNKFGSKFVTVIVTGMFADSIGRMIVDSIGLFSRMLLRA